MFVTIKNTLEAITNIMNNAPKNIAKFLIVFNFLNIISPYKNYIIIFDNKKEELLPHLFIAASIPSGCFLSYSFFK
jgi:hypothetical protein